MQKQIPVGEFKTHCYKLLEQSNKENNSFTITKRGKAIAQVIPINENINTPSIFGIMRNTASINGDIMKSVDIDWDAAQ